jgi:hypothetical protein
MATNIPLNKFRRVSYPLTDVPVAIYRAPSQRAGILLTALGTNTTASAKTITIGLSTDAPGSYIDLVKEIPLDAYDAANVIIGKVVIEEGDYVVVSSNDPLSGVKVTLSILEAINS